jgi:hypothetical protein
MFGNSQRKRRLDVRVAAVGVLLVAAFLVMASGASAASSVSLCVSSKQGVPVTSGECPANTKNVTYTPVVLPSEPAAQQTLISILPYIKFEQAGVGGKPTIRVTGANLQVVSGSGKTNGPVNGAGNLIIGYDDGANCEEKPGPFCGGGLPPQTGSHNLVLGTSQEYTSWGAILGGVGNRALARNTFVLGVANTASGIASSITSGGTEDKASGIGASVSGGASNTASGDEASVSGGFENKATEARASVSGGVQNSASGYVTSVAGGLSNEAFGPGAAILGGFNSKASGEVSSVSGGSGNAASGEVSSVSGGVRNEAGGEDSSVSGGTENTASERVAAVSGGLRNTASGENSSVSGGEANTASFEGDWIGGGKGNAETGVITEEGSFGQDASIAGGNENETTESYASILGGVKNKASAESSAVSGGKENAAAGKYSSILGGKLDETKVDFECIPSCP